MHILFNFAIFPSQIKSFSVHYDTHTHKKRTVGKKWELCRNFWRCPTDCKILFSLFFILFPFSTFATVFANCTRNVQCSFFYHYSKAHTRCFLQWQHMLQSNSNHLKLDLSVRDILNAFVVNVCIYIPNDIVLLCCALGNRTASIWLKIKLYVYASFEVKSNDSLDGCFSLLLFIRSVAEKSQTISNFVNTFMAK